MNKALIEVMSTGEAFDGEYLPNRKFYGKVDMASGFYVVAWDGAENKPPVLGADRKQNPDLQWDGPYPSLAEAKIVLGVEQGAEPSPDNAGTLTPGEAVLGFAAWLTRRKEAISLGAEHASPPVVDLVKEFCKANGFATPRDGWDNALVMPGAEKAEGA